MRNLSLIIVGFLLSGCIGTDFTDEPLRPAPAQAVIAEQSLSLLVGDSHLLSFRILASDGSEIEGAWQWSSRDEAVATVSSEGLVSAIGAGQVWVDGAVSAALRDSVLVTVVADPAAVAEVLIEGDASNLAVGESRQLMASARNAQGQILDGIPIDWSSSNPVAIAIDDDGRAVALSEGQADIIATAADIRSLPFRLEAGSGGGTVRTGSFRGLNGYNVQGSATLTQTNSGAELAFGSDFLSQSGPGLYVYLSPQENNVAGGVRLGKLSANSGAQSYAIPSTVNPDDFSFVIIYCQPFSIPFGVCSLQ
jgi:hypothetical protein